MSAIGGSADDRGDLGLVMSGGGARAAYQVGFLRYVGRRFPELHVPVLTGVSAGAINAAFLANATSHFRDRVDHLARLWYEIETDNVFRTGPLGLFTQGARAGLGVLSGGLYEPRVRSLVDTAPLRTYLRRVLGTRDGSLPGIRRNLDAGRLSSVAITATSYTTGRSVTWVQGEDIRHWERAGRVSASTELSVEHILASAALPILFPAIRVDDAWYGDGGMRLTAPLSPAVHLGARRILAISTRYAKTAPERGVPVTQGYPPPAQVAGVLMNSIFLDLFDGDALRLERINRLVEHMPEAERGRLETVRLLLMRPSEDLGRMANEYEPKLPRTFRWLTRGLGTRRTRSNDFLSLVMFQHDYLRRLVDLGERDAEARAAEIEAFLA